MLVSQILSIPHAFNDNFQSFLDHLWQGVKSWQTLAFISTGIAIAVLIDNHYSAKRNQAQAKTIEELKKQVQIERVRSGHQECDTLLKTQADLFLKSCLDVETAKGALKKELAANIAWCKTLEGLLLVTKGEKPEDYRTSTKKAEDLIRKLSTDLSKIGNQNLTYSNSFHTVEVFNGSTLSTDLNSIDTQFRSILVLAEKHRQRALRDFNDHIVKVRLVLEKRLEEMNK